MCCFEGRLLTLKISKKKYQNYYKYPKQLILKPNFASKKKLVQIKLSLNYILNILSHPQIKHFNLLNLEGISRKIKLKNVELDLKI